MNNSIRCVVFPRFLSLACGCLLAVDAMAQCTTTGSGAYWESYATGCGAPPVLAASGNPVLGTVVSLQTSSLPATTILAATGITFSPPGLPTSMLLSIPLAPGCWNYLAGSPVLLLAFPFGGVTDVPLPIPNSSQWQGTVLHAQSALLTIDTTTQLTEMSNAMCLHLGT